MTQDQDSSLLLAPPLRPDDVSHLLPSDNLGIETVFTQTLRHKDAQTVHQFLRVTGAFHLDQLPQQIDDLIDLRGNSLDQADFSHAGSNEI